MVIGVLGMIITLATPGVQLLWALGSGALIGWGWGLSREY